MPIGAITIINGLIFSKDAIAIDPQRLWRLMLIDILQSEAFLLFANAVFTVIGDIGGFLFSDVANLFRDYITSDNYTTFISVVLYLPTLLYFFRSIDKNFNAFTRHYGSLWGNIFYCIHNFAVMVVLHEFVVRAAIVAVELLKPDIAIHFSGISSTFIIAMMTCLTVIILEDRLLTRRASFVVQHRMSSWTILYYLYRHGPKSVSTSDKERLNPDDPVSIISAVLDDPAVAKRDSIPLGPNWWALRYHELYGRVSYIGIFWRICISVIIPIIGSEIAIYAVTSLLADRSEALVTIFEFVQGISIAFGAVAAVFFGPVLDVLPQGTPDRFAYALIFAKFLFVFMVLFCSSRGPVSGELIFGSVLAYTVMYFAWIGIMMNNLDPGTSYFDLIGVEMSRAAQLDGWLGWVFSFSGFENLIDELRDLTKTDFAYACVPGMIFWVYSTVRIGWVVYGSRAGIVTYRGAIWLPFISKGRRKGAKAWELAPDIQIPREDAPARSVSPMAVPTSRQVPTGAEREQPAVRHPPTTPTPPPPSVSGSQLSDGGLGVGPALMLHPRHAFKRSEAPVPIDAAASKRKGHVSRPDGQEQATADTDANDDRDSNRAPAEPAVDDADDASDNGTVTRRSVQPDAPEDSRTDADGSAKHEGNQTATELGTDAADVPLGRETVASKSAKPDTEASEPGLSASPSPVDEEGAHKSRGIFAVIGGVVILGGVAGWFLFLNQRLESMYHELCTESDAMQSDALSVQQVENICSCYTDWSVDDDLPYRLDDQLLSHCIDTRG